MTALDERSTTLGYSGGPRVRDVVLALLCILIDLTFSGYIVGDPATTHLGFTLPLWLFIGLVVAAYSLLAWRRKAPWPIFLGVFGFAFLAGVVVINFQPFTAVALALYTVAKWRPARQANPALVLVALLCLVNGQTAVAVRSEALNELVVTSVTFFIGNAVLWAIGRHERRTHLRSLAEQERLLEAAEDNLGHERQRIARDLHDILSHSMSAMILQSAGAKAVSSKLDESDQAKQVTDALAAIESTGVESMRELHRLLGLLRTDGEGEGDLIRLRLADITPLIEATRHGGLVVQVHREGTPVPLDPSVDLAAYHMIQESLTNAMKHAGRGAVVDLYETWEASELQLQVRCGSGMAADDGAITAPGSGTGLSGVNERVELAGGTFDAGPLDGGYLTTAAFPLDETKDPDHTKNPDTKDPDPKDPDPKDPDPKGLA